MNTLYITGAGVSAESGIPTFRGEDGFWTIGSKNYTPQEMATRHMYENNSTEFLSWYYQRFATYRNHGPNDVHFWLADKNLITQNIDGLHQRSGSTNVLELHGSIIRIKCTVCDFTDNITENFESLPPKCKCGSMLRPDVVWFGEPLPQNIWQSAIKEASICDVMIIVGTSLVVSPANTLPVYAKQNGAILIEVNPEKTVMSNDMTLSIQATSVGVLPKMLSIFKNE